MSWLELFKGLFWAILRRKENKKSREELERELARAIDKSEVWRKEAAHTWERVAKLEHRIEQLTLKLQERRIPVPTEQLYKGPPVVIRVTDRDGNPMDAVAEPTPIVPELWSSKIHDAHRDFARRIQNVATSQAIVSSFTVAKDPTDEPTL